jgi:hypothetical protein
MSLSALIKAGKWVDSWEDCKKFGPIKWSCKTRYADRTKSWTDSRSELAYSKNKGTLSAAQNLTINANQSIIIKAGFEASVETCSSCSNTSV